MQFWRPGTQAPGSTLDRESEAESSVVAHNRFANLGLQAQRERLPIFRHRSSLPPASPRARELIKLNLDSLSCLCFAGDRLLYLVEKYPILIVVGQTGCGKTTRAFPPSSPSSIHPR